MSVQGQFYLFGILFGTVLAWLATKTQFNREAGQRLSIIVLAVITIASFAYASRYGLFGTPANYYSTFSRAWELSLGALLSFVPARYFIPAPANTYTAGPVSYTHLTLPTILRSCRSRWSPYH